MREKVRLSFDQLEKSQDRKRKTTLQIVREPYKLYGSFMELFKKKKKSTTLEKQPARL